MLIKWQPDEDIFKITLGIFKGKAVITKPIDTVNEKKDY